MIAPLCDCDIGLLQVAVMVRVIVHVLQVTVMMMVMVHIAGDADADGACYR